MVEEKQKKDKKSNASFHMDGLNEEKILLYVHPFITQEEYVNSFSIGDIPRKYWNHISRNAADLNGRWQLLLDKSDSIDSIMKALGYNALKRQMMAYYPTIVEFHVNFNCQNVDCMEENDKNDKIQYPVISITTHLPLSFVKKGTVQYNCKYSILHDNELGAWNTAGCFIEGRAIQRREGEKGVMLDTRVVFFSSFEQIENEEIKNNCYDDLKEEEKDNDENKATNAVKEENREIIQLFRWTYIPHDTGIPIVANRWLKKLK